MNVEWFPAIAAWLLDAFNIVVIGYFLVLNSVYLSMSLFAFASLRRYALRMKAVDVAEEGSPNTK